MTVGCVLEISNHVEFRCREFIYFKHVAWVSFIAYSFSYVQSLTLWAVWFLLTHSFFLYMFAVCLNLQTYIETFWIFSQPSQLQVSHTWSTHLIKFSHKYLGELFFILKFISFLCHALSKIMVVFKTPPLFYLHIVLFCQIITKV